MIVNSTIYPFTTGLSEKGALEEFIDVYEEELKAFYQGKGKYLSNSFLVSHFGFDTELKEKVKNRWFKKGVILN